MGLLLPRTAGRIDEVSLRDICEPERGMKWTRYHHLPIEGMPGKWALGILNGKSLDLE